MTFTESWHPAHPVEQVIHDGPRWWAPRGKKMRRVTEFLGHVIIQESLDGTMRNCPGAMLRISRNNDETFAVAWSIVHLNKHSCSSVPFTRGELERAFTYYERHDLRDDRFDDDTRALERKTQYSFTAGAIGRFARLVSYLNIPSPGLGLEIDENLSLYITPEIWRAVKGLIRQS